FCLWNRDTTFVRANATSFEAVTPSGTLNSRRQRSIKIDFELRLHILGKLLPLPSNVENVDCAVAFRGDECDFNVTVMTGNDGRHPVQKANCILRNVFNVFASLKKLFKKMNGGRNAKPLLRLKNHALKFSIEQCFQLTAPAYNVVENLRKVIDLGWILFEIR